MTQRLCLTRACNFSLCADNCICIFLLNIGGWAAGDSLRWLKLQILRIESFNLSRLRNEIFQSRIEVKTESRKIYQVLQTSYVSWATMQEWYWKYFVRLCLWEETLQYFSVNCLNQCGPSMVPKHMEVFRKLMHKVCKYCNKITVLITKVTLPVEAATI